MEASTTAREQAAALLAGEAEGGGDDAVNSGFDFGVGGDEDGVLAAHFEDGALDEALAGLSPGGGLVDLEADLLASR